MTNILSDVNFKTIKNDPNFKEDSVREVVIVPLLKQLGYQQENIVRFRSNRKRLSTRSNSRGRTTKK